MEFNFTKHLRKQFTSLTDGCRLFMGLKGARSKLLLAFRMRAGLLMLFVVLLFGCKLTAKEHWHQYYKVNEDEAVLKYAWQAYAKAVSLYGEPVIKVREIHVRQSKRKRNISLLSRADILDWQRFASRFLQFAKTSAYQVFWQSLSRSSVATLAKAANGKRLGFTEQIGVINDLNSYISGKSKAVKKSGKRGLFGFRFGGGFGSKGSKKRKTLDKLFPGTILPHPKGKQVKEGLELCECDERTKGKFIIYTSSFKNDEAFYLQLAHESAHLLNTKIFDWYVEGLNNVFARDFAARMGHSFRPWSKRFSKRSRKDPYAIAYYMMDRLAEAAGNDMLSFLSYRVPRRGSGDYERLDINSWLRSLEPAKSSQLKTIILTYSKDLKRRKGKKNSFTEPY